jgi:hypothetical protein
MALIQEEKRGVGGKDAFHIICNTWGRPSNYDPLVTVVSSANGVRFTTSVDSFTMSSEQFNYLAEWLKSWGYV